MYDDLKSENNIDIIYALLFKSAEKTTLWFGNDCVYCEGGGSAAVLHTQGRITLTVLKSYCICLCFKPLVGFLKS